MQGPNQAAISGLASLIYTPENPGETLFQVPMVFDTDGYLLVERPAGSGILVRVQGPLVTQPANAHAIVTEAYNRALIAYSDLKTPVSPHQRLRAEHAAAGPVWTEATGRGMACTPRAYLVGEYVQPTAAGGNGHLYRCTVAGTTQRDRAGVAARRKCHGYRWRRNLGGADPGAGEPAARAQRTAAQPGWQAAEHSRPAAMSTWR